MAFDGAKGLFLAGITNIFLGDKQITLYKVIGSIICFGISLIFIKYGIHNLTKIYDPRIH